MLEQGPVLLTISGEVLLSLAFIFYVSREGRAGDESPSHDAVEP